MKKLIKMLRQGRKIRLIAVIAVIAIVSPLVANTILQRQKEARADSFFKMDEGYGIATTVIFGYNFTTL